MLIILIFAALVISGNAANIAIASTLEQYSEQASLFAFLLMFAAVFVIAWKLALFLVERFGLAGAQPETDRT